MSGKTGGTPKRRKQRKKAAVEEALKNWPNEERFSQEEEDLIYAYRDLKMEKELLETGEAIVQKYTDPEDDWYLAETVYQHYASYYEWVENPSEALRWYLKAVESRFPYEQSLWKDIAGCYVELNDRENADLWIERCMEHDKSKENPYYMPWLDFADYFQATGRPERALALCQKILEQEKYVSGHIWHVMSEAYKQLGDFENAVAVCQTYVDKFSKDEDGYLELATVVYHYNKDVAKVEELLLKAIELVKEDANYKSWIASIYHNLAVVYLNEEYLEKPFVFLKQYFEWKYPPEEYKVFKQLLENLPPIEDHEAAVGVYYAIINFEGSNLRPGSIKPVDGQASVRPEDEVRDAKKGGFDIQSLTNLDDLQSN